MAHFRMISAPRVPAVQGAGLRPADAKGNLLNDIARALADFWVAKKNERPV